MLKSLIKRIFGPKSTKAFKPDGFLVATINDKILPIDRGEVYEDPLDEYLKQRGFGEVTGGGTLQLESGEIKDCDVEIYLDDEPIDQKTINDIITFLEGLGVPKGSSLLIVKSNERIPFGQREGLGIYLDGANLPGNVYKECDSNFVMKELKKLTKDENEIYRYWEAPSVTAMYFYGNSYEEMDNAIKKFVIEYPLCRNAKIQRIA